ncbi:MAG: YGL010W-like membrane protein [Bacteroidia bacterium]|jgi:uncharacterized membrane protein YGL010W
MRKTRHMRKINTLLDTYGESHQNGTNKYIHWICVPAIFFSLVGLLYAVPIGGLATKTMWLNAGSIVLLLALVYYFILSKSLAIGFVFWGLFCLWLNSQIFEWVGANNAMMAYVSLAIFVTAWVFQFVGHKIEGKKPSFLQDIQFLLIGPAWLMGFIYKRLNISI